MILTLHRTGNCNFRCRRKLIASERIPAVKAVSIFRSRGEQFTFQYDQDAYAPIERDKKTGQAT